MILSYNSKFENQDEYIGSKFIGYITPEGEDLDYSTPFGLGGHDRNFVTDLFVHYFYNDTDANCKRFVYDSYLKGEEYKKAFREYCLEKLPKECGNTLSRFKTGWYVSRDELLELRILILKCYQNEDSNILMSEDSYIKMFESSHNLSGKTFSEKREEVEGYYYDYWSRMMLSFFKDTLVQYLGYDSVENVCLRTICTSYPNVNERFYNYKLMDFNILQVPRMMWDEKNKIYRPTLIEYQTEKEEILEKEIDSIRRLVKREKRSEYFRT